LETPKLKNMAKNIFFNYNLNYKNHFLHVIQLNYLGLEHIFKLSYLIETKKKV